MPTDNPMIEGALKLGATQLGDSPNLAGAMILTPKLGGMRLPPKGCLKEGGAHNKYKLYTDS